MLSTLFRVLSVLFFFFNHNLLAQENTTASADVIFLNAAVYKVSDSDPWATAVAIKNDLIIF